MISRSNRCIKRTYDSSSNSVRFRKVLKAIFLVDPSSEESSDAEHEALLLARLRHPHILRFYDSFIDASYYCIVTEYCEVNSSIETKQL